MALRLVKRTGGADCAAILAELPSWFGIPESNAAYAARAEAEPAWFAEEDGRAVGVMILHDPGFDAMENHLLAVRPEAHRTGVGRALIDQAHAEARARGAAFLTVRTLGPSREWEPYARTRAFYRAVGFVPLEESTDPWGAENPALLMVALVRPAGGAS